MTGSIFLKRQSALIFSVHSLAVPSKAAAESLLMAVGIKIVINSFYLTSCSWMSLMLFSHCCHSFSLNCLQLKLISAFFPCQVYFIVVRIVAGKNSCFTLCFESLRWREWKPSLFGRFANNNSQSFKVSPFLVCFPENFCNKLWNKVALKLRTFHQDLN